MTMELPVPNLRELRRRAIRWTVVVLLVIAALWWAPKLLYLYTEWLWFGEVHQRGVFWTTLVAKCELGVVFGLIFFVFLVGNVYLARRLAPRASWYDRERLIRLQAMEAFERAASRYLGAVLLLFAVLIAYGVGRGATAHWQDYLLFRHAVPFGASDPILHKDASFYVFRLPFWQYLWGFAFGSVLVTLLVTAGVHYLDKAIRFLKGTPALASHVKVHLSALLGLLLVMSALGYRLGGYQLLVSAHPDRIVAAGPGYTDVHVTLNAYRILFWLALGCAALVLANIRFRGWRLPGYAVGGLLVASLLGKAIIPAAVQEFNVKPNEQAKEAPYIEHHVTMTRQGYGLTDVVAKSFPPQPLAPADVNENPETIQSIRLWDYGPLLTTYKQLQELRPYYRFPDVDIDRYVIDGSYRQVMLSPRELSAEELPEQTWQNQHLFYTHGYGLCLSPVNQVTDEGLPDLFVHGIPPRSTVDVEISRPGIYYGELANEYLIVDRPGKGLPKREIDYPRGTESGRGEENVKTTYAGASGVPVGTWLTRVAMATRFGWNGRNILLSREVKSGSRILLRRQIETRAKAIAPFLRYDQDPYLAIRENGQLVWIHDAYTTSARYPYAARLPQAGAALNYLRNSVKVVTDAYDGTVEFYVMDDTDPLVRTYQAIFPELFKPLAAMPNDVRAHLRYPEYLFRAQSTMYLRYHIDPVDFYQQEDKWAVAAGGGDEGGAMVPYYVIMRLPGEAKAEFILMVPFTPSNKPNMISWMCGRCDEPNYGQLVVYEFGKQQLVYGPGQISARISQNPELSKLQQWWGSGGSSVIRGSLMVIPIGQSILYVEPWYIAASGAKIPELKLVILSSSGGRVHMGVTLEDALARVLGRLPPATADTLVGAAAPAPTPAEVKAPVTPAPGAAPEINALLEKALEHMDKSQERLREGDWAGYGEEQRKLRETLEELQRRRGQ